ncbi:D-glucuronyl C5-epimerase family protein [Campylobacter hominis]|uniref:Putative D-glucuronyl C5-epimerase (Heparin/heparansulfate:glucuronic acid C5 epimerase) n=1 Tax=Campylobacter hominis (strain ATCC BAA-381 / DSM 21671 / CCUG 45161 / LMG 19568 / NCTC 13146 / CH001A) TaxID=360107 RepID=A7I3C1_CAMHC|nr:D-glucuronyl C5-epimerase family protein [Campylobacter hominis]ABS52173.1 putative D-glucuronyl C5-epimerase (Heparin/heparansulfate:glucuronic acid C5 epimerase) [Campylobacter hominis ATCC BAA-381]UAK85769.1 D-glucuronyl C5-epimerase family protein [Campylobacter hominis]SUW85518.1 putative D-glucuronyl C5-epimerase (Heparin/heparansulfate:glucuronic acid C5 epimerase) [Campylobacter hominis]
MFKIKLLLVHICFASYLLSGDIYNLPKPYPLVNSNIEKFKNYSLDNKGIPLTEWGGDKIYYPIAISQIALYYYAHFYETGDLNSKKYFLNLAKWLLDNFKDNGDWGGVYCYNELYGSGYNLPNPWLSAMSQGFILSVFYEAYILTDKIDYLHMAEKVLNSFDIYSENGGFKSDWGTGIWYDEYPTSPKKHVLNGFIFSLAGLYDYYTYTNSDKAKKLFLQGIDSLKEHLASFDAGFNSYYSWSENPYIHGIASMVGNKYHDLHIDQLLWIYYVTNDMFFKNYAHKFLKQDFQDINKLYGLNNRFQNIYADYSIDEVNFGPNNLKDSNWTYGKYWSTNKFPTTLIVEFSRKINDISELVLVTTGDNIEENDFNLSIYYDNNTTENAKIFLSDRQEHRTRHFKANVHRFLIYIDNNNSKISKISITFNKHDGDILALREINFYYDMSEEMEFLLKKYIIK